MNTVRLLAASIAVVLLIGCKANKQTAAANEHDIALSAMSAPARATIERETRGGTVDKVTSEIERNRRCYDVEATVNGKHIEYLVAADTGEILGTEVPIAYSDVPAPVKAAAEKHFGTAR